jgi:hypothetical protein
MWGMRNRLVHDYGNTNYKILHDVVSANLPGLIATVETFLATPASPDGSANGPGASPGKPSPSTSHRFPSPSVPPSQRGGK